MDIQQARGIAKQLVAEYEIYRDLAQVVEYAAEADVLARAAEVRLPAAQAELANLLDRVATAKQSAAVAEKNTADDIERLRAEYDAKSQASEQASRERIAVAESEAQVEEMLAQNRVKQAQTKAEEAEAAQAVAQAKLDETRAALAAIKGGL